LKTNLKRSMLAALLAVVLVFSLAPMAAFAAAEAGEPVEVKLLAGRGYITVNGERVDVQAPIVQSNTTLVPLRVITKALGAGLQLKDNKIITLTYNDKKVVVTIGSKTVEVNGENKTIAAAPVIKNNTTLVPVRVIVEAFGANITWDKTTKEIVITGIFAGAPAGGGSIDVDQGKTKVGDSYLGWMMNYPPGLALLVQTDDGSYIQWEDATTGATVIVTTEHASDKLTVEELRDSIYEWFDYDEMTLDKRTIQVNGISFEKIVTRAKDSGMVYEYRAVQKGETLYIVIAGKEGKGISDIASYQPLLDSFRPTFDANDKTLKDMTRVVDGKISVTDEDYGLSMKLPVGWYKERYVSEGVGYSSDEASLEFYIYSETSGQTTKQWADNRLKLLAEDYKREYYRNESLTELKLADGTASVLSFDLSYDKKNWVTLHFVLLIKGDYRYEWAYSYWSPDKDKQEPIFKQIMSSVDVDTDYIEDNFGLVENDYENMDRSQKVTKTSKKYGYSVEIPAFWYSYDSSFERPTVYFDAPHGSMAVFHFENTSLSEFTDEEMMASLKEDGGSVLENATVQLGGNSYRKLVVEYKDESIPYRDYIYAIEKGSTLITFSFEVYEAAATEAALKRIEDVVASVKFN
jgi:Copper amine oxidase N-terminal domain.